MLHRRLLALTVVGALCSFMPAFARCAGTQAEAEPREARSWLMRIHEAASRRNFQGTFVVSAGGAVSSARIVHYCEGGQQYERIDSLDGQMRHVFRHNDRVHTLWPQLRLALIEQRDSLNPFPALPQGSDDRLGDFYDVEPQGFARVAGHEAHVLLLKPRDAFRFGYRLWADRESGLLLRSDVLGERGDILESSAFSDVTIDVRSQIESVLVPMRKLDGYRIVRRDLTRTRLEAEGWALRRTVPGFRQVSCVRRALEGPAEVDQGGSGAQALQTIFSDGLTYVSVFIEPFNPARHTRTMLTTLGATQTWMQRQGDWWITVVGDVPAKTLKAFAGGFERRK